MKPVRPLHAARPDFSRLPTPELVGAIAHSDGPRIRMMEELLARAPECEPGVVAALNALAAGVGADADPPPPPLWLAVVVGEMRSRGAVPGLLEMLRIAPRDDPVTFLAAAVALARIGGPAVAGLTELAREGEWWQRIWSYASLGWNADPRAGETLRTALTHERLLPDVIANALVDRGDRRDIPILLEALRPCGPDLRVEIEGAIRDLHAGRRRRPIDQDWRLRYQMNPGYGNIHPDWPGIAVMIREDDDGRLHLTVPPPPVRTLEEILADRDPEDDFPVDADGNRLCDCCGVPMWISTGATVCPATAAAIAWIQHRWLCAAGDDALLDDLFEVFDLVAGSPIATATPRAC